MPFSDNSTESTDHKPGGGSGRKEREGSNSEQYYRKLIREPKRRDLQVLCWNCNCGRAFNKGKCPHKDRYAK